MGTDWKAYTNKDHTLIPNTNDFTKLLNMVKKTKQCNIFEKCDRISEIYGVVIFTAFENKPYSLTFKVHIPTKD